MSSIIHRITRHWHGHAGVAASLFLVLIVFTGLALNHVEALKLDKRETNAAWLMRWYGLPAASPSHGFLLGKRYFSWEGDKWALGNQLLAGNAEHPVGAIAVGGINYVATPSTLYLYQAHGQLIDKIGTQSLPAYPILALGSREDNVVLRTPAAAFSSSDGLSWQKVAVESMAWASPQPLPDDVKSQMTDMLAPGLSLQRIVLDIHSGRILGIYGVLFVDFLSLVLLALAISGLWIYWWSMRKGRHRKRHQ